MQGEGNGGSIYMCVCVCVCVCKAAGESLVNSEKDGDTATQTERP